MKLLFDLELTQPTGSGKRHGGGKYGEVVFKKIVELGYPVSAFYNSAKWFNPEIKELIDKSDIPLYDKTELSLRDTILKYGFTRLYLPMEVYDDTMQISECELYGTIHGLRAVELVYDSMMLKYKSITFREKLVFAIKRFFPRIGYSHARKYYIGALQNSNFHFVTVSNHSANSLRAYFPEYSNNIDIPVFYSPSTSSNNVLSRKYNERYYLMVSANRWEKNVLRAIMAFDRLITSGYLKNVVVKVTGVANADIYSYKIKNLHAFQFLGYVDDSELEQLYHDAYAFVYPSLNEGFGYPPLEAMHYGVPVVTSSHTSISEVCEGAALYFNPFSIEEIMARILSIEDVSVHKDYSLRSCNQFQKITSKQNDDLVKLVKYLCD